VTKGYFAIPSLFAAGFATEDAQTLKDVSSVSGESGKATLIDTLRIQHRYNLAAHGSHSSHGSHGSHRSSSGGGYRVPRPATPLITPPSRNRRSTPPSTILPSSPAIAPKQKAPVFETQPSPHKKKLPALPGHTKKFVEILKRVQASLYVYGYYTGTVDGKMGPETRAAISKYQKDYKLPVTGTITPEVLNAFGIVAQ